MDFFVTGVAPSVHAWRDWHHKCGSKYNSIGCITACSASRNILIEAALRDFTHICIRRCFAWIDDMLDVVRKEKRNPYHLCTDMFL